MNVLTGRGEGGKNDWAGSGLAGFVDGSCILHGLGRDSQAGMVMAVIDFIIAKGDAIDYPDCDSCDKARCSDRCFEDHPASIPALKKILYPDVVRERIV